MFSINAKICTLKYNKENKDNILLFNNKKYIVPVYQRPYEWSFEQIQRFISDLFISFWGISRRSPPEQIFYGTMQLSKENEYNEHDIIDGQQRMSTLLLVLFVLKNKFPDAKELSDINFTWLSTRVNSGKQQEYLDKILTSDFKFIKNGNNPYQVNAALIKEYIEEQIIEEEEFDHNNFITHLLRNVYFAVIETNAGLSKTLQIFNSINTTGLDLNGADVFKIRMYEYLKDIKKQDETVFERIDGLYRMIIDNNEKRGGDISSIYEILQIYQYIIISKFKLPRDLYTYRTDTFFEQLFDTILKTNIWEHFKNNVDRVDLSLETLEKIIKIRYEWADFPFETIEDGCANSLIYCFSRYSRYSILKFLFIFCFKEQKNYFHNLMLFNRKLCKLYSIYSILYRKAVNEIHTFTYDLIDKIFSGNYEDVMKCITEKIGNPETHLLNYYGDDYYVEDILNGPIVDNTKLKNIVCRISAMLHEDISSGNSKAIQKVNGDLFWDISIDIEHIQSYKDENDDIRNDIWESWGDDINSIGNLMVLEYDINRSIKNKPYNKKINKYAESCFKVVQDQIINYPTWDLDDCKKRKKYEVDNILKYLFS